MMRSRQVSPVPEIGTPGLRWRGLETAYGEPKRARSWKRRIQPRGAYGALRQSSTLHLLDNALKYTAPGGEVRLITGQVHTDAVLRVRDTGEGIRAELRERVFDLFVQEPQALDRSRGGLGLGLALVKQLVDHRWETDRELAPVPRARARDRHRAAVELEPRGPDDATPPAASPTSNLRRRVFIVEDNADAREGLRLLLTHAGHEVETSEDALSGLEKLRTFQPDVALIDIGLPR